MRAPAIGLVVSALTLACARPTTRPCGATDPCAAAEQCFVGVCRAKDQVVVPAATRRVVLLAREVAVLSSAGELPAAAAVTPFGSRFAGEATLLATFDVALGRHAEVEAAYLVLDPEAESPGPTGVVRIEASRVLSPWAPASVSWGRAPRLGPAVGAALVPPARRAPVRIDVTEVVARSRGSGYGFALRASGTDPVGARLITAAGASSGPRLELYLR